MGVLKTIAESRRKFMVLTSFFTQVDVDASLHSDTHLTGLREMSSSERETPPVGHGEDATSCKEEHLRFVATSVGQPLEAKRIAAKSDGRTPPHNSALVSDPEHVVMYSYDAPARERKHRLDDVTRRFEVVLRSVLAGFLIVLMLPLILAAMMITVLTSRGPALYTQWRVGRDGRRFKIYKIRTMIHNSEGSAGARWASPDDPRVTRVGRFFRRTHIDELPQLWNVVHGEMNFVGPRPERPEILEEILKEIPSCVMRTTVNPGVTGLAQILQGPDVDLESVRTKLAYDLFYIEHRGLALDCKILLATPFRVLGLPAPVLGVLFLLPNLEDCRHFVAGLERNDPRRQDRPSADLNLRAEANSFRPSHHNDCGDGHVEAAP